MQSKPNKVLFEKFLGAPPTEFRLFWRVPSRRVVVKIVFDPLEHVHDVFCLVGFERFFIIRPGGVARLS